MTNLSQLKPFYGSTKKKKKVARGTSSGHGKTGGRGHKGQKSRAGGTKGIRFEGGQMPFYRRLPKMGTFKNYPFKKEFSVLNVSDLNIFDDKAKVSLIDLKEQFFSSTNKKYARQVKVLGSGDLKKSLTVEADAFSEEAVKKIEAAGGKAVKVNAQ